MVAAKERKRIFWLSGLIGLQDDERRDVQESVTGKRSMKEMTTRDAIRVIHTLSKIAVAHGLVPKAKRHLSAEESAARGIQTHSRRKEHNCDNVYSLASIEQRDKIKAMSCHIYGSFAEGRMDAFCMRQFDKPFRQLSSWDARELIEIQKQLLKRKLGKEESHE